MGHFFDFGNIKNNEIDSDNSPAFKASEGQPSLIVI